MSSTYKSYVKHIPGDNYIKREKHSKSSSSTNNATSPQQQQQQQPQVNTQPKKLTGLSKFAEGNYPDENQQELILLPLDETQLKLAFTLQDGGYQRPDKDKKKHKKHKKKKRKNRDGQNPDSQGDEHRKKKKKKDKHPQGGNQPQPMQVENVTVEH